MNVSEILYAKEESWGFGPGGNKTGVIMYALPKSEADKVTEEGIQYFNAISSTGPAHSWHGKYMAWHATPLPFGTKSWFEIPGLNQVVEKPDVKNYLNRYGFGIPIRSDVEEIINSAVASSGSYYTYGRIGMIFVVPKHHKVFYLYNG